MKELNIMEATVLTSPNPLTLICSKKEDGSTNAYGGLHTGKQSTGKCVRPAKSLSDKVAGAGAKGGRQYRDDG